MLCAHTTSGSESADPSPQPFIVHGTGGYAGTIDALRTLAPIGFVREDVRGDPASESTARAHAASYAK